MGTQGEDGDSITGRQRHVRHRSLLIAAAALVFVLGVAYGIRRGEWFLVLYSLYSVGPLALSFRPPTQVDPVGIRRPWRRPGFVPWSDVSAVLAPQLGMGGIRLQLITGKKAVLDDIPADRCAAVAAIGGKDVVRPVLPTMPAARPQAPRPRTDEDVLAEVTRQAAALARQREELSALSRRLTPSSYPG